LVATYTIVHGLAEFLTALTLFSSLTSWVSAAWLILIYNVLAFGCPSLIATGAVRTRLGQVSEGWYGLVGTVLMAGGLIAAGTGWACVLLLGVGSAGLHIAAGTATLKVPARGTAVGVFESSGAVGLALGTVLGTGTWHGAAATPWVWAGAAISLLGGLAVWRWGTDRAIPGLSASVAPSETKGTVLFVSTRSRVETNRTVPFVSPSAIVVTAVTVLGLASVARGIMAFAAPQPWKQGPWLVMAAAVAVALGRAVGGIAADRWGYVGPAVIGFAGAGILLAAWPAWAGAGIAGMCLLAVPMAPVILALVDALGRPSLAFGLAQLFQVPAALLTGLVLPPWAVAVTLIACAGLVLLLRRRVPATSPAGSVE